MKKYFLSIALSTALLFALPQTGRAMIEVIEQEPTEAIVISQPSAYVLRVANANGEVLRIYNIAGTCIKSFKVEGLDKSYDLNLPHGIYIVKVGKTARRITVR